MQAQMKFQKITAAFALISSAIFFVYALGFCTDLYVLAQYIDENSFMYVEGSRIFYDVQSFNSKALVYSIVALLLVAVMYMMQNTVRRKYYITNYVSSAAYIVFAFWISIYDRTNAMAFKDQFLTTVDFAAWKEWDEFQFYSTYTESTFWFDIGNTVAMIGIISALLILANLIWKTVWMLLEKKAVKLYVSKEV